MSGPRLVIFDMDGTLIDSQDHILAAMDGAFAGAGQVPPPREMVLSIVGLSLPEAMEVLAPDLEAQVQADLVDRYRNGFVSRREAGIAQGPPLYPGARDSLRRLGAAPGTLLGVATGKARRGLDHIFDLHDIGDHFVTAQTADDHPSKPHPSMIHAALAESGCASGQAIMVGDTDFDILMGRSAGIATIGVTWGYHPRARLEAAGADAIIDSFDALDAALADLWKAGA